MICMSPFSVFWLFLSPQFSPLWGAGLHVTCACPPYALSSLPCIWAAAPITAFIASLLSVTRALAFHALDRKSDCASHFCKVHAFPVIIGACRTRPMSAICFTPATCPCPESRAALFASPMRVKAAMSKATPDSHTSHLAEQNASSGLLT